MKRVAGSMMRLLGKRTCEDVVAVLCEYYEGTLEPKLAAIIAKHLRGCAACAAFARTYGEVVKLTGELPTEGIPEELRLRVQRALRERFASGKS